MGVLVQRQSTVSDDRSQVSCVDDEKDRSEDRSLRHTTDDVHNGRGLAPTVDLLFATGQVV